MPAYPVPLVPAQPLHPPQLPANTSGVISRSSLTLDDGKLYFGTLMPPNGGAAYFVALDASHGATLWGTLIDPHPAAALTGSPTVYDGHAYFGVSSYEESLGGNPGGYKCCSFAGSVVKVCQCATFLNPRPYE